MQTRDERYELLWQAAQDADMSGFARLGQAIRVQWGCWIW